jgi:hypothetical protein
VLPEVRPVRTEPGDGCKSWNLARWCAMLASNMTTARMLLFCRDWLRALCGEKTCNK